MQYTLMFVPVVVVVFIVVYTAIYHRSNWW